LNLRELKDNILVHEFIASYQKRQAVATTISVRLTSSPFYLECEQVFITTIVGKLRIEILAAALVMSKY
jgi:hypothetical protein